MPLEASYAIGWCLVSSTGLGMFGLGFLLRWNVRLSPLCPLIWEQFSFGSFRSSSPCGQSRGPGISRVQSGTMPRGSWRALRFLLLFALFISFPCCWAICLDVLLFIVACSCCRKPWQKMFLLWLLCAEVRFYTFLAVCKDLQPHLLHRCLSSVVVIFALYGSVVRRERTQLAFQLFFNSCWGNFSGSWRWYALVHFNV